MDSSCGKTISYIFIYSCNSEIKANTNFRLQLKALFRGFTCFFSSTRNTVLFLQSICKIETFFYDGALFSF